MRPLVLLAAFSILITLAPVANAGHVGPCWHEYVEIALYGAVNAQPKYITQGYVSCVNGTGAWVCDTISCD